MIIILLLFCNKSDIGSYGHGIPNAKAFDNLIKIYYLERMKHSDTVLVELGAHTELDGTVAKGSLWGYTFGLIKNNLEIIYIWYVWEDGKIELAYEGRSFSPHDVTELGPYLKINSDSAIQLAIKYGAKDYIKEHPHALVQMSYKWMAKLPVVKLWLYDPEQLGECEPQWWIRADNGDFLYSDYEFCKNKENE